jgi:hypothetical protein
MSDIGFAAFNMLHYLVMAAMLLCAIAVVSLVVTGKFQRAGQMAARICLAGAVAQGADFMAVLFAEPDYWTRLLFDLVTMIVVVFFYFHNRRRFDAANELRGTE